MPASTSNPYNLTLSRSWKTTYPGASAGILVVSNIPNGPYSPAFNYKRVGFEKEIRARFSTFDRIALAALPTIQAYETYYKKFKKTYHVFLQLESVALKGKPIPRVIPLIEAMFMAELKNQLLTAGHDLGSIQGTLQIYVATGKEKYVLLNGTEQMTKEGDMAIADEGGIISSIIYGPDQRTRITPESQGAVYTVYAPQGISEDAVYNHLEDIREFVLSAYPDGRVAQLKVYGPKDRIDFDVFSY